MNANSAASTPASMPALTTVPLAGCPVCARPPGEHSMQLPDFLHGVPGDFCYTRCSGCGTVYQNPRVADSDLLKCYPVDYYTHHAGREAHWASLPAPGSLRDRLRRAVLHYAHHYPLGEVPVGAKVLGWLLSWVPAIRQRARFGLDRVLLPQSPAVDRCLEVGPGEGVNLALLRMLGWHAVGLEIDPRAAVTARQVSGCPVEVGSLAQSSFPPRHFQLVFMNHVIEHVPDLQPALRSSMELLAPGGRLVLVYPNPQSLGASMQREYSCNWDAPRHLVLPPAKAMRDLLQRLGFVAVRCKTSARRAAAYNAVARRYRQGLPAQCLSGRVLWRDRGFQYLEALLVALGQPLGEEVVATAERPREAPHG